MIISHENQPLDQIESSLTLSLRSHRLGSTSTDILDEFGIVVKKEKVRRIFNDVDLCGAFVGR